jgi:hypothetical protein
VSSILQYAPEYTFKKSYFNQNSILKLALSQVMNVASLFSLHRSLLRRQRFKFFTELVRVVPADKRKGTTMAIDYDSLKHYKNIYGSLLVPLKFRFPNDSNVGFAAEKLGMHVHAIRNTYRRNSRFLTDESKRKLDELGFIWNAKMYHKQKVERGILRYSVLFNTSDIPKQFSVPHGDTNWDKEFWGMNLGKSQHYINEKEELQHQKIVMNGIKSLLPSSYSDKGYRIAEAVKTYKDLLVPEAEKKLFTIPRNFIVPADDERWPESTWGMDLGAQLSKIRCGGHHPLLRAPLLKLGLNLNRLPRFKIHVIVEAVIAYRKLHVAPSGAPLPFLIPQKFVVPSDDPRWPAMTWGLKLGQITASMRSKGFYPAFHNRLKKEGFAISTVRRLKRDQKDQKDEEPADVARLGPVKLAGNRCEVKS